MPNADKQSFCVFAIFYLFSLLLSLDKSQTNLNTLKQYICIYILLYSCVESVWYTLGIISHSAFLRNFHVRDMMVYSVFCVSKSTHVFRNLRTKLHSISINFGDRESILSIHIYVYAFMYIECISSNNNLAQKNPLCLLTNDTKKIIWMFLTKSAKKQILDTLDIYNFLI